MGLIEGEGQDLEQLVVRTAPDYENIRSAIVCVIQLSLLPSSALVLGAPTQSCNIRVPAGEQSRNNFE